MLKIVYTRKKGENDNQRNYNLATKILGLVTSLLLSEKANFEPYHYSGDCGGAQRIRSGRDTGDRRGESRKQAGIPGRQRKK